MRVWVLALLVLPLAGASEAPVQPGIWNPPGPSDVRLHFHVNSVLDFPINTQQMDPAYMQSQGLGAATHSQGCVTMPAGGVGSGTLHTYYGYASPGLVEYSTEGPRYHPERGLRQDLELGEDRKVFLDWYLESQWLGGDGEPDINSIPGFTPNVVVRATWREGDRISVGHVDMNAGRIIAQGETPPAMLSPFTALPEGVTHAMADGKHVYHFRIPMGIPQVQVVDQDEGMNVRIDVFMENPTCNDPAAGEYVMLDHVRVHSSDGHRPGMDIAVHDALRVHRVQAWMEGPDLFIEALVSSPFGHYDLDMGAYNATITGPSVAVPESMPKMPRTHVHGEPAPPGAAENPVWTWAEAGLQAKSGTYHAILSFRTLQGLEAAAVTAFDIGSGDMTSCSWHDGTAVCTKNAQPPVETTPIGWLIPVAALLVATLRRRP